MNRFSPNLPPYVTIKFRLKLAKKVIGHPLPFSSRTI